MRLPHPLDRRLDRAAQIVEGIRSGAAEVLVDDVTREVEAALPNDLQVLYPRARPGSPAVPAAATSARAASRAATAQPWPGSAWAPVIAPS
ncbi:hypothetical protein CLV37_11388 [Kineococcus rhizosphaerae]|uniref:Uncharacterized protein n=1 Tax=Kineococcus rhizosphaerae TaxID=559628 RepID=A0A2T0QYL3_9ACTN|nr:hypothetical protein CLV37_11388 [Kineococcus rhizosphaerae]